MDHSDCEEFITFNLQTELQLFYINISPLYSKNKSQQLPVTKPTDDDDGTISNYSLEPYSQEDTMKMSHLGDPQILWIHHTNEFRDIIAGRPTGCYMCGPQASGNRNS